MRPQTKERAAERVRKIAISGFKSITKAAQIELRPLTILAGANSSGKSSFVQPLLLLKQTLESGYDPGPLLLSGANVRCTSLDQLFARVGRRRMGASFTIRIEGGGDAAVGLEVGRERGAPIVRSMAFRNGSIAGTLRPELSSDEIWSLVEQSLRQLREAQPSSSSVSTALEKLDLEQAKKVKLKVVPERCFLNVASVDLDDLFELERLGPASPQALLRSVGGSFFGSAHIERCLTSLIHIPGLRGAPQRNYPITAVSTRFPGTFEPYVASVIADWQEHGHANLERLAGALSVLGLTGAVSARRVDDTQVELQVSRTLRGTRRGGDLESVADVGFGVSQVLPVLVALLAAGPGQLVYIEQPELHLHPRAQSALARLVADAARRGVQLILETHSSLLLLGVQTLVAEGSLDRDLVRLHWFQRSGAGATTVRSSDLDAAGAFDEDWPEDFASTSLEAEHRFLSAADSRRPA